MLFREGPEAPGNEIGMAQRRPQQFDALSVGWPRHTVAVGSTARADLSRASQIGGSDARLVSRFASCVPPQSTLQRAIDWANPGWLTHVVSVVQECHEVFTMPPMSVMHLATRHVDQGKTAGAHLSHRYSDLRPLNILTNGTTSALTCWRPSNMARRQNERVRCTRNQPHTGNSSATRRKNAMIWRR